IAVSFGIVAAVLGWLLISGFNENMQYYVSIKEVKAMPADDLTKGLRVKGKLVSGSLEQNAENLDKSFRIVQDNEVLTVHYSGLLPDTF
ncbi:cytochrome c maturation protein CcmE, partial [candidate division KSB1 bacterium]|nr:cytochrome c maturation protein CcmE [candidate division KSB1 bacterium]NIS23129.1 cytochrome c maturation protein CcmE [candidate division KSB1 bacterium]NIT73018.1 cytochrome c maturation protein CcmE [candidate division KSB1 bacterium]NIU23623.1 cytochrome c maturation protein CcmE [candidate division KSB1 bacterium]NIU91572.1 hypothetical protein [candidate division KSB1 bacterium]